MASISVQKTKQGKKYKVMYELPRVGNTRKRASKTFPVGTPKSVVEDFKSQKELELHQGILKPEENMTMNELMKIYFKSYTTGLSPTTINSYKEYCYNNTPYSLSNYFGDYMLKNINRHVIQQYINDMYEKQHVAIKTLRCRVNLMHVIFEEGIKSDIISIKDNPAEHLRYPRNDNPQEVEAYTIDEVRQMLKLSQQDHNDCVHLIIALGCLTGIRRAEMAALKYSDFDYDKCKLSINKARVCVKGNVVEKQPKTRTSKATIDVPTEIIDLIKEYRKNYLKNKLQYGAMFHDDDWVFCNNDGTPLYPQTLYHRYVRFIHSHKELRYLKFHSMRHTYATLLINNNASITTVRDLMRHSQTTTTLNIYSHSYSQKRQHEVDKLSDMVFEKQA